MTDTPTEEQPIKPEKFWLHIDSENKITNTKCTHCGIVTEHEWCTVHPTNNVTENVPVIGLPLVRRIIMCTQCGNLSLKK